MATKVAEVLRVFPLEPGSGRYVVENLTRETLHFPNVNQRTCDCKQAEIYPRNPKCYHLAEADAVERRRLDLIAAMPIKAARARQEAGRTSAPAIPGMGTDEAREVYGTVAIPGWDEKTEEQKRALFA
jgi:hypothetical protein